MLAYIITHQAVTIVFITATLFLLLVEFSRAFRDTCIVPLLPWLTSAATGLRGSLKVALSKHQQAAHDALNTWLRKSANRPSKCKYALLIKTPPVHNYGIITSNSPSDQAPPTSAIDWESYDTSSIPYIVTPSDFRAHISFCLVGKDVWESRSITLSDKLAHGLYWDIHSKGSWDAGVLWSHKNIRTISAVEVLGVVEEADDVVIANCNRCFNLLRQGWEYLNISWNDVDFAIILGLLVTGSCAAEKSKILFDAFWNLRVQQVLRPRSQACIKPFVGSWVIGFTSGLVTAATLGLAAPVTGPVFVGSWCAALGFGIAGTGMQIREEAMLRKRNAACRKLLNQFPQLEPILSSYRAK
ncbi:hypothetical protein K449DRAFT_334693 [Hypoxylon sp. EC38]|nr:hypothetical protein K449DRAFT_334693 [Hypoxylon sp. EC38]